MKRNISILFKTKLNTKMKERGITLIALVVTIVVLIILAGVSVSMLTGENGIITKVQQAKEKNKKGEDDEKVKLEAYENILKNLRVGDNENALSNNELLSIAESVKASIKDDILAESYATQYPVGSIYISTNSTMPTAIANLGTWDSFGEGRTLIGAGTDTYIDNAPTFSGDGTNNANIGGAYSFDMAHTHGLNNGYAKLFIGSNASGDYWRVYRKQDVSIDWISNYIFTQSGASGVLNSENYNYATALGGTTDTAGTTQSLLQPYITVYMWKRIA